MIKVEQNPINQTVEITLAPNCSLTPRQTAAFLVISGTVVLGIGGLFAVWGLWPVLPFSGLEWLILFWAFRHVGARRTQWERLIIGESIIRYESCLDGPVQAMTFQRAWVRVVWNKSPYRGHPRRLSLGSHGNQVFVGELLAEAERQSVYDRLRIILDK